MIAINNENEKIVNEIIQTLVNKSIRTFKYTSYKSLRKQATYFSPVYRDFILKLIKNNSLKIKNNYRSFIVPDYGEKEGLQKRTTNELFTDINNPIALAHELGHQIDFWFGKNNSLTSNVVLYDNKTFFDIFTQEFEEKHAELYATVMNEYKQIINSNINSGAYNIFINNIDLYRSLENCRGKERKRIQKELYENGFQEVYYQVYQKSCYQILAQKYIPILDALSSKYQIRDMLLPGHGMHYYNISKEKAAIEFFANVFADKVGSNHNRFGELIKLMPKSFDAFERLFVIFYDHIQNNKRFTDVKIKKEDREA